MHELSIAISLIEIGEEAARNAGAVRVRTVYARIGKLSGVVKDALLFSFDIAARGTLLEGSRLDIAELPVVVHCDTCARDVELPDLRSFRCPDCATPASRVVRGRELELVSMEIDDGIRSESENS